MGRGGIGPSDPGLYRPGGAGNARTIFLDLPLQVLVYTLTASIWILLALFLTGVIDAALWLIPLVLGLILSFAMA